MFKFVVRASCCAFDVKGAFRLPLRHIFEKLGCSQLKCLLRAEIKAVLVTLA